MAKLVIDDQEIEVADHLTLLQACEEAGAEIPRFCYHERLSIAGNCRMCLVEVLGGPPKPVASCAMGVRDLRPGPNGEPPVIKTGSKMVKKAREGVLEFLLINHPLDCPICDQGGECDLQDQAMAYGIDTNRYKENKRAVEDKYIGPLVKTIMTRCIHCTRCVRFTTEVAGVSELGLLGRGEDAAITTYLEAAMTSEMQGNVIDLCPVGALTSRPYAFQARPWELTKTETIDVMDALGSNIRVDARGSQVLRIMPRVNDAINEEWISDKTRFVWDGLSTQRLDTPYVRDDTGRLQPVNWQRAFSVAAAKISAAPAEKIGAIAGDLAALEDIFALRALMDKLGVANLDCRSDGARLHPERGRSTYLFNTTIAGIEEADAILLVGSNPRFEAPVLNARIRKRWRMGGCEIAMIGDPGADEDLRYEAMRLGVNGDALALLAHDDGPFSDTLKQAQRPLFIIGQGALTRPDGDAVLALVAGLADKYGGLDEAWNGFSVLHTAAGRVGGLDLGFVPQGDGLDVAGMIDATASHALDVLFLLGADEINTATLGKDTCVIYIGSHGDAAAHRADVIFPAAAYTEKSAHYVNTEGRVQRSVRAVFAPGEAREEWKIMRALSDHLKRSLPFDTLAHLRQQMFAAHPHLAQCGEIAAGDVNDIRRMADARAPLSGTPFTPCIEDFFLTNPIARASKVMAQLSAARHTPLRAAE